jgi:hypothetical protein
MSEEEPTPATPSWEGTIKEKVQFEDLIYAQIETIRQAKLIQDYMKNVENLEDLLNAYIDRDYQQEVNKAIDERQALIEKTKQIVSSDKLREQELRQAKQLEIDEYYTRKKYRALMKLLRVYGFTPKPKIPGEI